MALPENTVFLCGGVNVALVSKEDQLQVLVYSTLRLFFIFKDCIDPQIKKVTPKDVVLCCFDESGGRLVVVTNQGLIVFFRLDINNGQTFKDIEGHEFKAIYKTMRVVFSDGCIVPFRCALEDQFLHSVSTCPVGKNGTILVPFAIVLTDFCALVRVQPPDGTSCLVRIAYDTDDTALDGLPTRQAFVSPDWHFVYEQGILDLKVRQNTVYILTHTCLVELCLSDHNPFPIIYALPNDVAKLEFADAYTDYVKRYREFVNTPLEWIVNTHETGPIPDAWETVLTTRPDNRLYVQMTLANREKSRPLSPSPLHCLVKVTFHEHENAIVNEARTCFTDTSPSATCPWREIALTSSHIYLNSIDGLYALTQKGWHAVIDKKSALPVVAASIVSSKNFIYSQPEEGVPWTAHTVDGDQRILPELKRPILAIYNVEPHSVKIICSDAIHHLNDEPQTCPLAVSGDAE